MTVLIVLWFVIMLCISFQLVCLVRRKRRIQVVMKAFYLEEAKYLADLAKIDAALAESRLSKVDPDRVADCFALRIKRMEEFSGYLEEAIRQIGEK